MTKKTVKDLGLEVIELSKVVSNMNENLETMNENLSTLSREQDILKKKLKEYESENEEIECVTCKEVFKSKTELLKHMQTHRTNKLCELCGKNFKYEDIKQKHKAIAHENIKIYCHYFNNRKECPFSQDCVFLHEVSAPCRYGIVCVRDKCMFRHGDQEKKDEHCEQMDDKNDEIDVIEIVEIAIIHNVATENDDEKEKNVDVPNKVNVDDETEEIDIIPNVADETTAEKETYVKAPTIVNVEDESSEIETNDKEQEVSAPDNSDPNTIITANHTTAIDSISGSRKFVCLTCKFEATRKEEMKQHKENIHNWCSLCFSTFRNKELLMTHTSKTHTDKLKI